MIGVTRPSSMGKARGKEENPGLRIIQHREACECDRSGSPPLHSPSPLNTDSPDRHNLHYITHSSSTLSHSPVAHLRYVLAPPDHSRPACRLSLIIAILARAYIFNPIRPSFPELGDASLALSASANIHSCHSPSNGGVTLHLPPLRLGRRSVIPGIK